MSTNMDGATDALIQEVLDLPVEELQTLLSAVTAKLRPLVDLINAIPLGKWDVILVGIDPTKKIQAIKEVRAIANLGLKEAKDIVEAVHGGREVKILAGVDEDLARKAVLTLQAANAKAWAVAESTY